MNHGGHVGGLRAFSGEVATGSPPENATNKEKLSEARFH
jgi:hypothetical protein